MTSVSWNRLWHVLKWRLLSTSTMSYRDLNQRHSMSNNKSCHLLWLVQTSESFTDFDEDQNPTEKLQAYSSNYSVWLSHYFPLSCPVPMDGIYYLMNSEICPDFFQCFLGILPQYLLTAVVLHGYAISKEEELSLVTCSGSKSVFNPQMALSALQIYLLCP